MMETILTETPLPNSVETMIVLYVLSVMLLVSMVLVWFYLPPPPASAGQNSTEQDGALCAQGPGTRSQEPGETADKEKKNEE